MHRLPLAFLTINIDQKSSVQKYIICDTWVGKSLYSSQVNLCHQHLVGEPESLMEINAYMIQLVGLGIIHCRVARFFLCFDYHIKENL